jgi:alpha-ketoglutarate-dependent taurine dioxygenase
MKLSPNVQGAPSGASPVTAAAAPHEATLRAFPGGLGAELRDIDLLIPASESLAAQIRAAFLAHYIIVVRDQQLTKPEMARFAAMFGEIEGNVFRKPDGSTMEAVHEISNLDAAGRPAENPYLKSNYHWHTDKAYLPTPALLTMLHAIELPPSGGDTQFADMTSAFATLPDETKRRIADLRVVHSLEYMRRATDDRPPTKEEKEAAPPVTHPLVRTHPETGAKSLYIGMYCSHVVGMPEAEGRALLDELLGHATQDRFVYTHRWQPGDVVLWDNRCLLHRAVPNYAMGRAGASCSDSWSRVAPSPDRVKACDPDVGSRRERQ